MPSAQRSPLSHLSRESRQRVAAAVDGGLSQARREIRRALDNVQLRLRAWQASLDPGVAAWAQRARKEVAEGHTADKIAKQVPISELAAKWREEHPGG